MSGSTPEQIRARNPYYRANDKFTTRDPEPVHPPRPNTDATLLPLILQAALMQMHESQVNRALVSRLTLEARAKIEAQDYHKLVDLQLAEKRPRERWHTLTVWGRIAVADLEQKLCQRFDIHLFVERQGKLRFDSMFSCPCGWSTTVPRGRSAGGWARIYYAKHLERAKQQQEQASEAEAKSA